jgi:hypothetical protein
MKRRMSAKSVHKALMAVVYASSALIILLVIMAISQGPKRICLLGDSTMAGEYIGPSIHDSRPDIGAIDNRAKVGSRVEQIPVVAGYDTVFVLTGINNIYAGEPASRIMGRMIKLNSELKICNKHVIFICPLPCQNYRLWTPAIQTQLDRLFIYMVGTRGFESKRMQPYMSDDNRTLRLEYDAGDGLHLSGDGQYRLGGILSLIVITH